MTAKQDITVLQSQSDVLHIGGRFRRGGEGQPVFVDDCFFLGIEYPCALNDFYGDCIFLHQYPWLELKAGESYTFPQVVYGFQNSATLEETFIRYIEKYSPMRRQKGPSIYNDWAAHDELGSGPELTEELVCRQLEQLEKARAAAGISFDYYTMDAFWFEENVPYTRFKEKNWPDGPGKVFERMRKNGMKPGLWFDVNSDLVKLREGGGRRRPGCEFQKCLADPEYLKLLEEGILYNVKKYDLRMLKLDFADFTCTDPEHTYHASTETASKEPAVRGLIGILEKVRVLQPDMMITAYNGFTVSPDWMGVVDPTRTGYAISPWWAFYLEYIYCGDPRPSEYPAKSLRQSIHWYIDAMVRVFHDALLPLSFIDDCGVMVGDADTIYHLGKTDWRDGWMLSMSRGGKKLHFYGDFTLLDNSDLEFMKKSWMMFERLRVSKEKMKTKLILGNPILGEPYGYSNEDGFGGYITLVNPAGEEKTVTVALEDWHPGTRQSLRVLYKDSEFVSGPWDSIGDTLCITLKPEEVLVLEWKPEVREKYPSGILTMLPHSCAVIQLGQEQVDSIKMKFFRMGGGTLRSYTALPEGFEILGSIGESKVTQNVWSGLSWNDFWIKSDGKLKFVNHSEMEINVMWEAYASKEKEKQRTKADF